MARIRPAPTPMSKVCCSGRSGRRTLRMTRSIKKAPPPTVWAARGTFLFGRLGLAFALEVGGLDEGPPTLDLGLVVGAQRLGGLLLRWRDGLAEVLQPLDEGRVCERLHGRPGQGGDPVPGGALGHEQARPG